MTLKIGSLCSGYGGLDLAVQKVFNAETSWFCEYDEAPSKILAHHYPETRNYRDVTQVDWAKLPPVEVITAGYPCQPFSISGNRKGTNDERHIWPYVREAIRVLRPKLVVLENVAGHRSLGFDRVLGDMAEDGLHVRWGSFRASHVGAPHHRERLFIIATSTYAGCLGRQSRVLHKRVQTKKPRLDFSEDVLPRWAGEVGPEPSFTDIRGRLNPEYPEWMMGLPRGWVTDPAIKLSYRDQLKAIGNGVCPQQAAFAIRHLLTMETP